ncbi:MAG: translation initiation factor IF-2 [Patescibacteria group bacterium]|nr:translation initiation factor IF-2 [Patescibacteria group bacterium]
MTKKKETKKEYNLVRPPVVTFLGHVDHGKTSILDAIRGTRLQVCEAGGITQNIRAHQIEYKAKTGTAYKITFIDTPGHEAFSEMRSRGANVTDIVVLVVAVDDGVKPQTKEAISFAKESKVPIIVAINKVDLKGHDLAKIKRELSTAGVQAEDLGGNVMFVKVSAKKKTGLDQLIETILLVAEMQELKMQKPKEGIAEAVVLESTTDKSQGPISLCLVKSGEISIGNYVGWEDKCATIRALKNETFCSQEKAQVSDPVWISGFQKEIPIGVKLVFYPNQSDVKAIKNEASETPDEEKELSEVLDEDILSQLLEAKTDEDDIIELNIVIKSESQGTLEVALKELQKVSSDDVAIKILHSGTGEITEDDILKAKNAKGIVIGFKSKIASKNQKIAKQEKVLVRNYEIIYELIDEVADVLESMKEPVEIEVEIARAKVLKTFELSNGSMIAGCKVLKGTILKGYRCYAERLSDKEKARVGEGKITSIRHNKDEVKETHKGSECGILLEPQIDLEKDDEIVCFKIEKSQ